MVSGSAEGVGIVPPPTAEVSAADFSKLTDRVQHSLKWSFESEELPGALNQFVQFFSAKKHAPVVFSAFSAPAALGAPPPDISFFPSAFPAPRVVWRGVLVPISGIDRRLVLPLP